LRARVDGLSAPWRRTTTPEGGTDETLEHVQAWRGMKMVDVDGDKIGTVEDIFLALRPVRPRGRR
jgi:hypothetical protein